MEIKDPCNFILEGQYRSVSVICPNVLLFKKGERLSGKLFFSCNSSKRDENKTSGQTCNDIAKLNGLKIKQVQQEVAVFGFHLIYNCS